MFLPDDPLSTLNYMKAYYVLSFLSGAAVVQNGTYCGAIAGRHCSPNVFLNFTGQPSVS